MAKAKKLSRAEATKIRDKANAIMGAKSWK